MTKATSPIRLQADLMDDATLTGERFHRSAAEQVEYWASIGQKVSKVLDPDTLLSISAGLMRVQVEPVYAQPLSPEDVFTHLESERAQGTLPQIVSNSPICYQQSLTHPGYLERINADGSATVGQFSHGEFKPLDEMTD